MGFLLTRLLFLVVVAFLIELLSSDTFLINATTLSPRRVNVGMNVDGDVINEAFSGAFTLDSSKVEDDQYDDSEEDESGECEEYCDDDDDEGDCCAPPKTPSMSLNLTAYVLEEFNTLTEPTVVINANESWRECFACYRFTRLSGHNLDVRTIEADTCHMKNNEDSIMPTTRCFIRESLNRSLAVGDDAMPYCAKSYIRTNVSELLLYGCYTPHLWTIRKNAANLYRRNNVSSSCQNSFGQRGENISVYTWCCEDDLCNGSAMPIFSNHYSCQHLLITIVIILIARTIQNILN